MTDIPCFRALWALLALTALHLWPLHTAPMGPGALFRLSSGLSALVWSKLLSFAALLWLSLAVPPTLWPCLAGCFLCLVLELLPWTGQLLALVTVTRADPDVTSQLDLVTRDFPAVGAWLGLVLPGACPPLLAQAGQGQCLLRSQPHIPCGAASPVVSNTWKLGKLSSGSFTEQFLFSS